MRRGGGRKRGGEAPSIQFRETQERENKELKQQQYKQQGYEKLIFSTTSDFSTGPLLHPSPPSTGSLEKKGDKRLGR